MTDQGNHAIPPDEFEKLLAAQSLERSKQFANDLMDAYPQARELLVKLAAAIQDQPVNLPITLLALAMFNYCMRESVKENFRLTDEQADFAWEIAEIVADKVGERSDSVTVRDPRTGSLHQFATMDAAKAFVTKIREEELKKGEVKK